MPRFDLLALLDFASVSIVSQNIETQYDNTTCIIRGVVIGIMSPPQVWHRDLSNTVLVPAARPRSVQVGRYLC